jgi:hypothetical protein
MIRKCFSNLKIKLELYHKHKMDMIIDRVVTNLILVLDQIVINILSLVFLNYFQERIKTHLHKQNTLQWTHLLKTNQAYRVIFKSQALTKQIISYRIPV